MHRFNVVEIIKKENANKRFSILSYTFSSENKRRKKKKNDETLNVWLSIDGVSARRRQFGRLYARRIHKYRNIYSKKKNWMQVWHEYGECSATWLNTPIKPATETETATLSKSD